MSRFFLLAVAGLAATASGLFRDQAGELDWRVENVGAVSHAVYQQRRCYALTRAGGGQALVAALNTRTGGVEWRRALPPGEAGDGVVVAGNAAVTLSGRGRGSAWRLAAAALGRAAPRRASGAALLALNKHGAAGVAGSDCVVVALGGGGRGASTAAPAAVAGFRGASPRTAKLAGALRSGGAKGARASSPSSPPRTAGLLAAGLAGDKAWRTAAAAFLGSACDALFSIFKDAAALKEAKKLANARRYGFDKLAVLATGGQSAPLHFHVVGAARGALRCFMVAPGGLRAVELGAVVVAGGPGDAILDVAYGDAGPVSSKAHVLGDDALLLKYLNPHLAVVLSSSPGGAPAPLLDAKLRVADVAAEDQVEPPTLYVTLVDVVKASVAHRVAVPHGGAPAKAILNENWVIYSYWNHKAKRAELGSLSLHEGMIERFGLSPFKVPEQESTASAWSLPPPVALQRTFALPKPVTALGATATSRGIAGKHILKLNAIYATDAKLESTSLVLATGVDVFGCRHTPSGAFDLIADDFNYALLLLLLLGLSVGALLLRKAAQAKNLAIQWV
ncbi:hypothetical protein JL721_11001 [Aureococcus anophagefferens]|nr:hypothetical protein JL721_11001 [Aureococcus anophagefferens]